MMISALKAFVRMVLCDYERIVTKNFDRFVIIMEVIKFVVVVLVTSGCHKIAAKLLALAWKRPNMGKEKQFRPQIGLTRTFSSPVMAHGDLND